MPVIVVPTLNYAIVICGALILSLLTACTAGNSKIIPSQTPQIPQDTVETSLDRNQTILSELQRKLQKYKDKPDFPATTGECVDEKFLRCLNIDNPLCAKIFKVSAFDCREQTNLEFTGSFDLKNQQQYDFMQACIANALLGYSLNAQGISATKMCLISE